MKNGKLYWSLLLLIVLFLTVSGAIAYANIKQDSKNISFRGFAEKHAVWPVEEFKRIS